ncbi:MAG: septal ring lytic transglycosylase RlpA family protein [Candidatus Tectomicrobia bacterium]|uniref:Probable endolytic peptidoglycan transglycosylase RlpA n=1 Tax=Tectimicrobiota bacterium TaxID=2528274 RepID=A0A933GPJ6_UNCTE|nr:septal ring lytic transglycosylase RlpA family protein [Candidatus Tectomicrobia bacterium]
MASFLSGCAGKAKKPSLSARSPTVLKPLPDFREDGIASWYGYPYHGRKTSNGEIYDMHRLTAAHRTLPLGTWVYVTNLENGKRVKVRINDRGPFVWGRVIDMSKAGAAALGFEQQGLARVSLSLAEPIPEIVLIKQRFAIQVGAFIVKDNADNLKVRLEKGYQQVYLEQYYEFFRVRIGGYLSKDAAEKEAFRLAKEGFYPFITSQD